MQRPRISIVIDNYNYARYLRASIDSALAQTHDDVEVIVVDDGSTDESARVLSEYGDRIAAVLKPNGGQASAFNAGLLASRGDLIIFLDADDFLFPEAASRAASAWEDGVAVVRYRLQNANEHGQLQPWGSPAPCQQLADGDVSARILRGKFYVCPPASGNAFSRRVLEQVMPIPEGSFRTGADFYLHALVPLYGAVRAVDARLGAYRLHGANAGGGRGFAFEHLDHNVRLILLRAELIAQRAATLGLPTALADELALADAEAISMIVALKLVAPSADRLPARSLRWLCWRGMRALYEDSTASSRERAKLLSWFLLVASTPAAVARRVALDARRFRLRSPV